MKNLLCFIAIYSCMVFDLSSQTLSWSGFPAGGTTYSTGIMTATITSVSPGFQNGTPKYYAGNTVGSGECGITGGLALEHRFGNITNAHSSLTMDFTSGSTTNGLCGNISFQVKDINSNENVQTFADWVEVSAIDGNNNSIPVANITATGGSNKVITASGNTRIVKGHNNSSYGSRSSTACDNVTFSVAPPAGTTLKSVTLKYHPDYTPSPNDYYNLLSPKRPDYQYISISPITVNASAGPTSVVLTSTDASCNQSNGTVNIGTVTGGTSPYQFNFNSLGMGSTTSFSNLAGGTYPVTVLDNNGCMLNATATVNVAAGPTAIATSSTSAGCNQNNGTVTLGAVTGGVAPYQYNFNSLGLSSTTSFSGLAAGTYPVVVSDNGGCTFNTTVTVGTASGPTAIAASSTAAACGQSNGTVTLGSVTGGSSPYQYNFNGLGLSSTTSFSGLAAGSYPVVVSDNGGCTFNTTVTVGTASGPTAIAMSSTAAACGQSNGTVTLGSVTGGSSPYQYNFNGLGLSLTTNFSGLPAASYPVVVSDNNGCTFNTTVTVGTANGPTAIAVSHTDVACGQSNGTVTLGAVTGGSAPYQYNFNGGGLNSTTSFTNLATGNYTILVSDNNGCTFNTSVTIASANGPTAIVVNTNDAICGGNNGSVQLGAVTGGSAPYQYNFNAAGFASATSFSNLASGNYTLIVRDNNGCTYNVPVVVNASGTGPTAIAANTTADFCGQSNGTVTLGTVTGGTSPYQYNFNGSGLSASTNFTSLAAGNYTLTVQDNNGCSYNTSVTVASAGGPVSIVINTTPDACGQGSGAVSLGSVSGGTAPYQYDFGAQGFSSNVSYTALAGGSYTVIVRDANGCTYSSTANVAMTSGPTDIMVNTVSASCAGTNGSATLGNVTGGTAPFEYEFNNLGFSANQHFSGLAAGNYPLTIIDANGCAYNTTVLVPGLPNGPSSVNYENVIPECGSGTGSIHVLNVVGGVGPYTYSLNGATPVSGTEFLNLEQGVYDLEVRDFNGCTTSILVPLTNGSGEESLRIPNVFTPNGDNANPEWFIDGSCVKELECIILNRWGNVVETFDAISDKWDGTFSGNAVVQGVYFYKAKVTFWSGKTEDYHGHITVLY